MKKNRKILLPLLLILTASLFLSACTGGRFEPEGWPGMIVEGDTLYVSYRDHIYFLDQDGNEIGRFPQERINGATFFAPPAVIGDDLMVAGSYTGSLYKFNAVTGQPVGNVFQKNQSRFLDTPLLVNGTLFVPDTNHFLYALDLDFNQQWERELNEPLWSAPALIGQTLYHTSIDNQIYAINSNTGEVLWQEDLGGTMLAAPTVGEDGLLYIGSFNREVIAYDPARRARVWTFETTESVWSSPVIVDGVVYATDLEGFAYALDQSTGKAIWQTDVNGRITGQALVLEESLYVSTEDGTLAALNLADGSVRWQRQVPVQEAKAYSTPFAWGEDMVIFGLVDADQVVLAYDTNGTLLWEFVPQD
jgi:outer membrane protein assembly factor BamB